MLETNQTKVSKKRCDRLDEISDRINKIESTLVRHDKAIEELKVETTKQDKILHSGPILPYENDKGVTLDLVKDFNALTNTVYACRVFRHMFTRNEISQYVISDDPSWDKSHQTNRKRFSSEDDIAKINKLKGNKNKKYKVVLHMHKLYIFYILKML